MRPSQLRRRTAAVAAIAALGLAGPLATSGASAQALPAAAYSFAPSPVAVTGTLTAGAKVPVVLTATKADGSAAGGATVYLSFAPTTGGGQLMSHGLPMGAAPTAFKADAAGHIKMNFQAPSTLPTSGSDVITAANAATGGTIVVQDSYTYVPSGLSAGDWPMFHLNATHSGVSSDAILGAAHAPSMALLWSADIAATCPKAGCGQIVASPSVVYNSTLGVSLVYVADYWGTVFAFDAVTGAKVWSRQLSGRILGSVAVSGNMVFIGSANHLMYELNATTGAVMCTLDTGGIITSAPVVADPGTGNVVYFGDHGTTWQPPQNGHLWAMNPSGCTLKWMWDAFGNPAGSLTGQVGEWSQPGFAFDATGRPLVVFGSANEDDEIYALDANTGSTVWQFQTLKGTDTDVGAGPTISAPGTNGFAHGVVYETGKDRIVYALDLTTGAQIWSFNVKAANPGPQGDTVSVAALNGTNLLLGWGAGIYDLNAVTGVPIWKVAGLPEMATSPAVSGAPGDQVVFIGDIGGGFHAYSLSGTELYSMNTGGAIFGSPAVSNGRVYFTDAATDRLYALG